MILIGCFKDMEKVLEYEDSDHIDNLGSCRASGTKVRQSPLLLQIRHRFQTLGAFEQ